MKSTLSILLLAILWMPAVSLAQVGGTTTAPIAQNEPIGERVSIVGSGFDDAANQVYVVFSGPVAPQDPTLPVGGFTLWVNNIVRPLVNGGATTGSQSVEAFFSPVGIDIAKGDSIRIAYSPSTNPLVSRGGSIRVDAIPVTVVTNGLDGDVSCPRMRKRLVGIYPERNIFVGYFDERVGRSGSAFQEYGGGNNVKVGDTALQNIITLSLGSNFASRAIDTKPIDWTQPLAITVDEATTIIDTVGNKACPGTYDMLMPGTPLSENIQPARAPGVSEEVTPPVAPTKPDSTTTTPALPSTPITAADVSTETSPADLPSAQLPSIIGLTTVEPSGSYKVGSTLSVMATISGPVDKTSQLILELNAGNKRVLLKPVPTDTTALIGTFIVTKNMVQDKPLRVSRIVASKLISAADKTKINTATTAPWLDPASLNNIDKEIIIEP